MAACQLPKTKATARSHEPSVNTLAHAVPLADPRRDDTLATDDRLRRDRARTGDFVRALDGIEEQLCQGLVSGRIGVQTVDADPVVQMHRERLIQVHDSRAFSQS